MRSPTHGNVNMRDVALIIKDYIKNNTERNNHIVIGTDSQNFEDTKVVVVIAVYTEGKGGKFFYDVTRIHRISNVSQKLHMETSMSLAYADELISELDNVSLEDNFDYTEYCTIGIHVDAGYNGPSGLVIPEITGWIKSMGYDVTVKPDSFVASTIADRISK